MTFCAKQPLQQKLDTLELLKKNSLPEQAFDQSVSSAHNSQTPL